MIMARHKAHGINPSMIKLASTLKIRPAADAPPMAIINITV